MSSQSTHEAEEPTVGETQRGGASREQLLDFIKRQKLKIKKLENDNKALEFKLTVSSSGAPTMQSEGLFWGLIGRQPDFQQRIARAALRSMIGPFRRRNSVKIYFSTWKTALRKSKLVELEAKLEESTKNSIELEKRCLKLKGLLSRTHQANKQQVEDTNAFLKRCVLAT
jgi:hypothetical protein